MSIDEFDELKRKAKGSTQTQEISCATKIVVAMGRCGIAAGAREVMSAIVDEVSKRNLKDVSISQIGCIGMCEQEPIIQVIRPGQPKVTYGYVTPEIARTIIDQHVIGGRIFSDCVVSIE